MLNDQLLCSQSIVKYWILCLSSIILLEGNKIYKYFKICKLSDNQYSKHHKQLYISYKRFKDVKDRIHFLLKEYGNFIGSPVI